MELCNFISNTILDIIEGIQSAQAENKSNAIINTEIGPDRRDFRQTQQLEFDIVLSLITEKSSRRGIGVALPILEGGLGNSKKMYDKSDSRVRFSVPITLPAKVIGPSQDAEDQ